VSALAKLNDTLYKKNSVGRVGGTAVRVLVDYIEVDGRRRM